MSYQPSELDPLLPKDKPAPEIHGSRPTSFNGDIGDVEIQCQECVDEAEGGVERAPTRKLINNFMTLILGLCILASFWFIVLPDDIWREKPETLEGRVNRILTETPLIDGHNDLAILIRFLYNNHIYDEEFKKPFEEGGMEGHVDIPRLKEGKNGGAFWSAFVPCPANGTDFSDENYADAISFTLTQIDLLARLQATYPVLISPPPNSTTALPYFRSSQLISPIAIEGLHQIGNRPSNLRHYHSLGVRYATLTHNCHNKYADAALTEVRGGGVEPAKPIHHGVSTEGKAIIREMNRLGMIVDLSHTSKETQLDVLAGKDEWKGSASPVIFSHSSAYALCPHPRNVQDDVLQFVKEKRGLVMVNFSPDFVSCHTNASNPDGMPIFDDKNSTLEHVADHILYIGNKIGFEHVGLGSDFDGIPSTPRGLNDVSKFPDLVKEMLKRNVSDADASKVVGGNLLRVWREVDDVALKMQGEGVRPVEDELAGLGVF